MAPDDDGGQPSPLRWLIMEEVGALSPSMFQQLERELRQYCGNGFPGSRDARGRERSFAGLNIILVGDFYQLDPVSGQYFWHEDPTPVNQIGIDLLRREFGGQSLIELREQCRVLDSEFEREVLRPLRETDDGPSAAGLRILQSRVLDPTDANTLHRLTASGTPLITYCNSQKCDHMRSRARQFAISCKQRLYWSVAKDWLSGEGTRRAWADRMDTLAEQKLGWLGLDDSKTARRLGCVPLCVGLPVILSDHLNRPKGLVAGTPGIVKEIWFDGGPPTHANCRGEYVCSQVPLAVLVQFEGFDEPIPVSRSAQGFRLGVAKTATEITRLQLPLLPNFGMTMHLAQGTTLPSALVELNLPSSGDRTAAYIALSRVRRREDLFILRAFDPSHLRRKATKASVDILLQRLRGDLRDCDEGSKLCMRCRKMRPRSAFVDAATHSTRQWMSNDRRCDCACISCPRLELTG
eukprot:gene19254-biopygen33633